MNTKCIEPILVLLTTLINTTYNWMRVFNALLLSICSLFQSICNNTFADICTHTFFFVINFDLPVYSESHYFNFTHTECYIINSQQMTNERFHWNNLFYFSLYSLYRRFMIAFSVLILSICFHYLFQTKKMIIIKFL